MSTGLAKYDEMTRAIVEAHRVDEVKDLRDQARALEIYAHQAQNKDAEARAAQIRLRAERRCGELIREQQASGELAAHGGDRKIKVVRHDLDFKTLNDIGISRDQSSKFQKLADIPQAEFEERMNTHIANGDIPSTAGVIREFSDTQPVVEKGDPDALRIWGEVRRLRELSGRRSGKELALAMTAMMKEDVLKDAPHVIDLITELLEGCSE